MLAVIVPTIIATVLLALLLNPVIIDRAAYFLPIPLFLGVSAFFSFFIGVLRTPYQLPNLLGFILIALIISGFVVADVNRFESAITYYQVVDSQTLDTLNWISQHTLRNDTVYTNYPGLSAWIAGYAERNVLFPSAPGYILTAPDYALATAANTIDAGNYVLSSQQLTVGDFFPSSIQNPAFYINSLSGKHGLLFSDDDFNYVNFTDSSGLRSANLVSANSKVFDGYSQNSTLDSLQFNYSWAFAQGTRSVSLSPPTVIRIRLSFFAGASNNTSLTSRFIAFSGERLDYTSFGNNTGLLKATLSNGEPIGVSLVASSQTGKVLIGFNQEDPTTRLPALMVQTSTHGPNVELDISMSIQGLALGPEIAFSYAFATLKTYGVDYLVLDLRAYSQEVRFLHSQTMTSIVFQNSKVLILRISL